MLTFGSLFAGIGGIDLGLERAGMRCAWQVEIDDYAQRVLAKHWPDVPRFRDVRNVGAGELPRVDIIAGGFPCQDISASGPRVGLSGERSGLWFEYARIIRELRPRYVLVENVSDLLYRGVDRVLGDLAALGFNAEWEVISACAVGAPHARERLFILAYAQSTEWGPLSAARRRMDYTHDGVFQRKESASWLEQRSQEVGWGTWANQSRMGRVAHGVPARMDRLSGLGNAVVPQVAELVGRAIVAFDGGAANAPQ